MLLSEPSTMLTDYGLSALCGLFAWRLWRTANEAGRTSVRYWGAGLAGLGVAALAGGTFHGFSLVLPQSVLHGVWKVTAYAVGVAGFCLFVGALVASVPASPRRLLVPIPAVKLAVYAGWMVRHDDFRYVIYDYAATLLVILALQAHAGLVRREPGAPWIAGGVLVAFAAAVVQRSGLSLHPHFNHNDLYHVIQMAGTYLFYRGARLLKDR